MGKKITSRVIWFYMGFAHKKSRYIPINHHYIMGFNEDSMGIHGMFDGIKPRCAGNIDDVLMAISMVN